METDINKSNRPVIDKMLLVLIAISSFPHLIAQQISIDSLKYAISETRVDTEKIALLETLAWRYREEKKMDSSVLTYKEAFEINEKGNYWPLRQCSEIAAIDYILYEMSNYSESLKYASLHLALSSKINDTVEKGASHLVFGHDYRELGEYRQSLNHYFKAREFFKLFWVSRNKPEGNTYTMLCIGETYLKMNNPDSALIFTQQAFKEALRNSEGGLILLATRIFGDIYLTKGDDETALGYYRQYVPDFVKYKEKNRDLGFVLNNISKILKKRNQIDSAIFYAKKALSNAERYNDQDNIFNAAIQLSDFYKYTDERASFDYFKMATTAKDSMISGDKLKQAQILSFNEQIREKELQEANAKETAWYRLIVIAGAILVAVISFLIWNRLGQLRLKYKMILDQKEVEKIKAKHEKELLELEATALRAQMNPHFIFNCLNSIKSLIQQKDEEKAVGYLTTFSKLIRTIFQNSDKREITLFDEIETCKLYMQLESMRFGNKFFYYFNTDETIDLKSVHVPALIIQPFIENAIWHGIMPKNEGGTVSVVIEKKEGRIYCIIDDDGIGREMSGQNKFIKETSTHQSRGVHLTQSRLDLNNVLNQRSTSVEIFDKTGDDGRPAGTKIVLTFGVF